MPTASIRVIREGQYWAADKLMDETLNGIEQMPRCCTTLGEAWQNCTRNLCKAIGQKYGSELSSDITRIIVKVFVFEIIPNSSYLHDS